MTAAGQGKHGEAAVEKIEELHQPEDFLAPQSVPYVRLKIEGEFKIKAHGEYKGVSLRFLLKNPKTYAKLNA